MADNVDARTPRDTRRHPNPRATVEATSWSIWRLWAWGIALFLPVFVFVETVVLR
jgi:hypothetical protein